MIANPLPRGEISRRGTELYELSIRSAVESQHAGKYLVLDVETGAYEIDENHLIASNRAAAKRPDAILFTIRIGFPVGGRIGCRAKAHRR